jgi:thioredoxin-related protein
MKIFRHIYLLLLFSTLYINAQNERSIDLNWQTDFEVAQKLASSQNKLILIYFTGSDWSQSCKRLNKDFFYTEKFQKIALKNLILVRVNAPRRPGLISSFQENKNLELKNRFNQKVFPTVIITDVTGKKLGILESYNYLNDTSKHYALIENALKM